MQADADAICLAVKQRAPLVSFDRGRYTLPGSESLPTGFLLDSGALLQRPDARFS
jgi:hypothetical protein